MIQYTFIKLFKHPIRFNFLYINRYIHNENIYQKTI